MIYRQSNYKEPVPKIVQIASGMWVSRNHIRSVSRSGLVTFKDGSTYLGDLVILAREGFTPDT